MVVRALAYALRYLLWHDARRAEYLADYLGSTVSGTQAMRTMLGKLYYGSRLTFLLNRGLHGTKQMAQRDYEAFIGQVTRVPLDQLEHINQPDPGAQLLLELDHPPIGYRLEFLQANPVHQAKYSLSAQDERQIRDELNAVSQNRYKYIPGIYDNEFEHEPSGID